AVFAGGLARNSVQKTAIAMLAFLAVSGPFIAAISYAKGRPTFGDSGRLAYAECIGEVNVWYPGDGGRLPCSSGGLPENVDGRSSVQDSLLHPPTRLFDDPA